MTIAALPLPIVAMAAQTASMFCLLTARAIRPASSRPTNPIRGKCGSCWTSEFHRDRKELYNEFRMGELLGSPLPQDRVFATNLIVNFFDGGPRTTVDYRVGGRAPIKMERVVRPDPFVEEVFARNEATKKPWVKAEPSSHIWTARLPHDLEAGTHCIAVTVIDEYGREHNDHLIVEVTASEQTPQARPG